MNVSESWQFFVSGALLGFTAGVSPGPLLALVISETLMHGRKEGILVSTAPVFTDLPIIFMTVFLLLKIFVSDIFLGLISLAGAGFIGYLACKNIMIGGMHMHIRHAKPQSLRKGVIANFLNPHPYLFWMTIGGPIILKAFRADIFPAALFLTGFYLLLVGSKIIIALIVNRSKSFLQSNMYAYIIKATGIILLFFAGMFLKEGLILLGVKW